MTKEHESLENPHRWIEAGYLNRMFALLKTDRNFANYLISIALISGLGKMAFVFQTVLAKERLAITNEHISYATFLLLISQTAGYLLWGFFGDKYGFKFTLQVSAVIFIPAILFTNLMSSVGVFYISIVLLGIAQSARNVNENNLAINLCRDPNAQPFYIGVRNLLTSPFLAFNSVLAGIICDFSGYTVLFIASALFMAAGMFVMSRGVREYR
jgi:MFS family permease